MSRYILLCGAMASAAFGTTITVFPGDALQDSLNLLSQGDSLFLSPGTYTDDSPLPMLQCGSSLQGVVILSDPLNRAVLDGEDAERSVIVLAGPFSSPVFIENLVITGGNATGGEFFNGGGLFCEEASGVVSNCLFSGNNALIGGGIGAEGGSLLLQYSTLQNNQALVTGGGVDIYACDFTGYMLKFISNSSSDDGGGLNSYQSSIMLSSALFAGNYSGDDGGGATILQGTSTLEYITMHGNQAADDGGGLRIHTIDSLSISSSIITSNLGKAGINVISDTPPVISHVCCWNNEFANYHGMDDPTGTDGNISQNPIYADAGLNLSQIAAGQPVESPAVNSGHEPLTGSSVSGFSTRTDSLPDSGTADMGFHHLSGDQTGIETGDCCSEAIISVCPSPVTGVSVLRVQGVTGSDVQLRFFDLTGRLLHEFDVTADEGSTVFQLLPGTFPSGIVLVRADWETGHAGGRFVISP